MSFDDASATLRVALLIVAVAGLLAAAAATRVPRSIALFAGGVGVALWLGSPRDVVEPQLLIGLLLPPLLYGATVTTSPGLLRRVALPGLAVGALLIVATGVAAATVTAALVPGLGWAAVAFMGVIAAVADTRLVGELGLSERVPRSADEALKGQGVAAPLLLLSAFLLIIENLGGAPPGAGEIAGSFARDWLGGGLLGAALGWGIARLRRAIETGPIEIAVSIATPFLVAALAEALSISVIVPLIAAALTISHFAIAADGRAVSSPDARIIGRNFWREAEVVLAGLQFFLSGFVLPGALTELRDYDFGQAALLAAALLVTVGLVQLVAGLLAAAATSGATSRVRLGVLIGLLPARSGLALLIVLAVPATLPDGGRFAERDLILVTTIVLVVASVLLKWATVRLLLRWAGIDAASEREAERATADQALAGVDGADEAGVAAARARVLALRRDGVLGDEAALAAQGRLDLAARAGARLDARSAEEH